MKEELKLLNDYLKKKDLTYSEFNELIGNYFVKNYEELDDDIYLIEVIRPSKCSKEVYNDYVRVIK